MRVLEVIAGRAPQQRPRPPVRIDLQRGIPAWLLRAAGGAAVTVGTTVVLGDWVVPVALGLVVALVAHQGVIAGVGLLAAVLLLTTPPDLEACAIVVLVVHLVMLTVRLTAPLSPVGRVETALLWRVGAAFVVVQLIAQACVGVAFAALAGLPPLPWFGVLALAAIAAAVVAAVRWVGRHTQ